jgi:uncharacterized protein (DUF433 family)
MDTLKHIEMNADVLLGKPVIKGTRIPVALVLNLLEHGYTIERILKAYPNIKKADVLAAIRYSAMRINREEITPLRVRAYRARVS